MPNRMDAEVYFNHPNDLDAARPALHANDFNTRHPEFVDGTSTAVWFEVNALADDRVVFIERLRSIVAPFGGLVVEGENIAPVPRSPEDEAADEADSIRTWAVVLGEVLRYVPEVFRAPAVHAALESPMPTVNDRWEKRVINDLVVMLITMLEVTRDRKGPTPEQIAKEEARGLAAEDAAYEEVARQYEAYQARRRDILGGREPKPWREPPGNPGPKPWQKPF
jgi:hypothetical protein